MHRYIPYLKDQYEKGKVTRREFLRYATLLGVSIGTAQVLAACPPAAPPAAPTAPEAVAATPTPESAMPRRGGRMRLTGHVQRVDHPARLSWVQPSNHLRQVAEYLTLTDRDNITHPWLLERWEASDNLLTWDLHLRQGITFNSGDPFTADDVLFSMEQWLNPDVGSSTLGLMAYLSPGNIEKVDNHHVRLHLDLPEIAVPEHLFHYPNLMLNHRTFEGDFIRAPHGTGAFTLEDWSEGERALFRRRDDYWQTGEDGEPLPYMDEVEWIDIGDDPTALISALQAGEVDQLDTADVGGIGLIEPLRDAAGVQVLPVLTAQARVLRMRVDLEPWDDNRVRQALKLCQNRDSILELAYFGEGSQGQDFHVAPVHPEYYEMPIPEYDPERARELLVEAGYENGLNVSIAVGSGWEDVMRYAQILQEDAAPAGFNITLETMPNPQYWERWTEVDLGITGWTHRPLGTMALNLAYTADDEGNPVPWNETRWVDEEFSVLLTRANSILDVDERRQVFADLQRIQLERGSIGISYWRNIWFFARDHVKNLQAHPTLYQFLNEVWLDEPA